ncbi:threonine/serine exporter family protein [Singulisphaera sp. Ch08]|uniref:Threonine/serine exporter family protein n=1 Tax=Singulisphaera sp. Ch08 TaxID=3120278 RepID=A0AAU7C757_9BACT
MSVTSPSATPNQDAAAASSQAADEELILALGRALHQVGQPAHRLESTLGRVADRLELELQAFSLPTGLLISFERPGEGATTTRLLRLPPRPTNLECLRRLSIESETLACGRFAPREAIERIKELMNDSRRWGPVASVLGFLLSASAFSVFFGGGLRELSVATVLGLAVGLVALAFGNSRSLSRRFELTAAAVAGFIAALSDAYIGHYVHWIPLASGLVILLPGLSLVDSIEELANGHLASGASRMAGVGIVFLALIFGVLMGVELVGLIAEEVQPGGAIPLPWWAKLLALPVVALGSTFRFQARLADMPWILLGSAVAFGASRAGTRLGNPLLGPFMGALVLGMVANLYARWYEPTPQLLIVPGLALLVPGSFGLRSLDSLLSGATVTGLEQGFQMFMMTIALVAGLLFSNSMVASEVNPRQTAGP